MKILRSIVLLIGLFMIPSVVSSSIIKDTMDLSDNNEATISERAMPESNSVQGTTDGDALDKEQRDLRRGYGYGGKGVRGGRYGKGGRHGMGGRYGKKHYHTPTYNYGGYGNKYYPQGPYHGNHKPGYPYHNDYGDHDKGDCEWIVSTITGFIGPSVSQGSGSGSEGDSYLFSGEVYENSDLSGTVFADWTGSCQRFEDQPGGGGTCQFTYTSRAAGFSIMFQGDLYDRAVSTVSYLSVVGATETRQPIIIQSGRALQDRGLTSNASGNNEVTAIYSTTDGTDVFEDASAYLLEITVFVEICPLDHFEEVPELLF